MKAIYKAPAKINLGLEVLRKRDDAYHEICTVMIPVEWFDTISLDPSKELSFSSTGFDEGIDPENNLCLDAAKLILRNYPKAGSVAIQLDKQIPIGAGLGGGSSDAATVLLGMNEVFGLGISAANLRILSEDLGSDVPFFIDGLPAMAEGRGEILSHIEIPALESRDDLQICVVMPRDEFVSTAEAYGNLRLKEGARTSLKAKIGADLSEWKELLVNDFEASVGVGHPKILELKNWMYEQGAIYASMSGSGAAVFGIFDHELEDSVRVGLERFSDRFIISSVQSS